MRHTHTNKNYTETKKQIMHKIISTQMIDDLKIKIEIRK